MKNSQTEAPISSPVSTEVEHEHMHDHHHGGHDHDKCDMHENCCKRKSPLLMILVPVLLVVAAVVGTWYYKDSQVKNTITVSGKSQTRVKNQVADFSLTITSTNANKSLAVQDVSDKASTVVKQLNDFGLPAEDVQTTNFNVYQQDTAYLDAGLTKYQKGDWSATYTVNVTLRDLTKSADLTKLMSSVDNASMYGPNLRVDNTTVNDNKLLQEAVADARAKAEAMAMNTGRTVGKVASMSEGSSEYPTPYPMMYDKVVTAGGGAGIPIEAGSSDVYKTVSVSFYLK